MKITERQLRNIVRQIITEQTSGGWGSYADQRRSQEIYEKPTEGMPRAVKYNGESYFWTGKVGTDQRTGEPAREYRNYDDNGDARLWMGLDGTITPD